MVDCYIHYITVIEIYSIPLYIVHQFWLVDITIIYPLNHHIPIKSS